MMEVNDKETSEGLRKEEEQAILRMVASVIVGYSALEGIEDPEEREDEEAELNDADRELQVIIEFYSERHGLDHNKTVEQFADNAMQFIESGQYDQEVEDMLAEEGRLAEHIDPKNIH